MFFLEEDLDVQYAADVSGFAPMMRTSRQHFADTVCKIRRVVSALLLREKNVGRAEGGPFKGEGIVQTANLA